MTDTRKYYEKDQTGSFVEHSDTLVVDLDFLLNHEERGEDALVYIEVLEPVTPGAVDGAVCEYAFVGTLGQAVMYAEGADVDYLFVTPSDEDDDLRYGVTLVKLPSWFGARPTQFPPAGDPGLGAALNDYPVKWGN